jgi:hypothetical protein
MSGARVCFLSALALMLVPALSSAKTIEVTTGVDEYGIGAKCGLREAVEAANSNSPFGGCPKGGGRDTIVLKGRTYKIGISAIGTEDANAEGDLDVAANVTLAGAGAGKTRIEGNGEVTRERVLNQISGDLEVSRLTIRDGLQAANSDEGGGIYNQGSGELTVSRSRVLENYSFAYGAGVVSEGDLLTIEQSRVADNACFDYGGGVHFLGGPGTMLVVRKSRVVGNRCDDGSPGIYLDSGSSMRLIDSVVRDNAGRESGGGVYLSGGTVTIARSTIAGNNAYDGDAAGIDAFNVSDELVIRDSTIAGNVSSGAGGGLFLRNSPTTITNSTITGNTGDIGGGVFVDSGSLEMNNVTLAGNFASMAVGGVEADSNPVSFSNTIIARNRANGDSGFESDCSTGTTSLGHNLLGTDTCDTSGSGDLFGTVAVPLDPRLGELGANGGLTETKPLLGGSPAINAGGSDCEPRDQRGERRRKCDIGAYER